MVLYADKHFITNSEHPNDDWTGNADWVIPDDSELAQKIKRLYPNFDFVFGDDGKPVDVIETSEPVENVIPIKKKELSEACEKAIIAGVDLGDAHYSLTIEDQANILAWMAVAQTGKAVPYHQDGQPCRIYTAEEFLEVANAAVVHKTHHTTYCNLLMRQVEAMTDVDDVKAVEYGITQLEGEYAEQYQVIMASLVSGDTLTDENKASNDNEVSDEVTDETIN